MDPNPCTEARLRSPPPSLQARGPRPPACAALLRPPATPPGCAACDVVQVVALVALAVSRAANVWPCTWLANYFRPPELRIPAGQQLMIWFSGMRGAMAFAMALRALDELSRALHDASTGAHPLYIFCCASSCWESTAKVPQSMLGTYTVQNCNVHVEFQRMQTERSSYSDIFGCMFVEPVGHALLVCTFFVVLLTVLFNGGASTWMMSTLKLRAEDEKMCDCPFPPIVPQMSACPIFRVALRCIDTHSIRVITITTQRWSIYMEPVNFQHPSR